VETKKNDDLHRALVDYGWVSWELFISIAVPTFAFIFVLHYTCIVVIFFFISAKLLTDRSSGQGRNDNTIQSHMVGVKFWMTDGLSKGAVLAQENIGAKDGSIDSHLKAAK
jgi:hypothetical protein